MSKLLAHSFTTNSYDFWGQGQTRGVSEPRLGLLIEPSLLRGGSNRRTIQVVLTVEPYSFQFRCKLGIFPENVPICQGKFGSRR